RDEARPGDGRPRLVARPARRLVGAARGARRPEEREGGLRRRHRRRGDRARAPVPRAQERLDLRHHAEEGGAAAEEVSRVVRSVPGATAVGSPPLGPREVAAPGDVMRTPPDRPSALVAIAALAFLAAAASAQGSKAPAKTVEARKWEHETSDLKPDPRFTFGALKNGFRYVWFKNDEPKKKVFLRLHVNVGSFEETETELGIAHFIEHMAFNGTKNFKAGTLVETFNKEGIKFGHDVNAHTGTDETVYELDLPDASTERFTTALKWFRDVADGLK